MVVAGYSAATRQAGMTLVEQLIVLAILGILLAAGMTLTSGWVRSARINEAKSKLLQAYGMARAVAQRNPNGVAAPGAAAGFRLDGRNLFVCSGSPATTPDCSATGAAVKWQAVLPDNTTVAIGSGAATLGLDNTGLPLSTTDFTITNGSDHESGSLL